MSQKTSHVRGIRAALAAAGSTIHPALTPGSALWLWALAAAVLFGVAGCPSWGPPRRRACGVASGARRCGRDRHARPATRGAAVADRARRRGDARRRLAAGGDRRMDGPHGQRARVVAAVRGPAAADDARGRRRRLSGAPPPRRSSTSFVTRGCAPPSSRRWAARRARRCPISTTSRATRTSTPLEALLRNVLAIVVPERDGRRSHCSRTDHRLVTRIDVAPRAAEILDDEIGHSRLGWRMLQTWRRASTPHARAAGRVPGPGVRPAVRAALHGRRGAPPGGGGGAGRAGRRDSTSLFVDVVNEVIVPRLEAFDLPARAGGRGRARRAGRRRRHRSSGRRPTSRSARAGSRTEAATTARPAPGRVSCKATSHPFRAAARRATRPAPISSDQSVGEAPARGPSRGGPCSAPRLPSMIARRDGRGPRAFLGRSRRRAPHRSGARCPAGRRGSTPRWTSRRAPGAATGSRATTSRRAGGAPERRRRDGRRALVGSPARRRSLPRVRVRARRRRRAGAVRAPLRRRDRAHRASLRAAGAAGRRSGAAAAREAVHGAGRRRRRARPSGRPRIAIVHRSGLPAELGARHDDAHVHRLRPRPRRVARGPDRATSWSRCCPSRRAIRSCSCSSAST